MRKSSSQDHHHSLTSPFIHAHECKHSHQIILIESVVCVDTLLRRGLPILFSKSPASTLTSNFVRCRKSASHIPGLREIDYQILAPTTSYLDLFLTRKKQLSACVQDELAFPISHVNWSAVGDESPSESLRGCKTGGPSQAKGATTSVVRPHQKGRASADRSRATPGCHATSRRLSAVERIPPPRSSQLSKNPHPVCPAP